jgi:hypothetical protein
MTRATRRRPALAAALIAALLAGLPAGPARAAITVYTDLAAFLAAIAPGSFTETFSSLPGFAVLPNPQTFSGGGYGFQASASFNQLAVNVIGGDKSLSVLFGNSALVIGALSGPGPVTAIGGFFFAGDAAGSAVEPLVGVTVSATAGAASVTQSIAAPTSTTSFLGFVSDSDPFGTVSVVRATGAQTGWASVDNLILGARATTVPPPAAVPAPAALGLFGLGLLGLGLLRRRG